MYLFATWLVGGLAAVSSAPIPLAQPTPSALQDDGDSALFLRAGRLIVAPGTVLENAQLVIEDGVITAIGTELEKPDGAQELEGAVVCAGFIDPWSTFGLTGTAANETKASVATRTMDAIDVFSNDHLRREILRAGVTTVRAQGGGLGPFGGIGAVVRLAPALSREAAFVLEDANVGAAVGITATRAVDVFDRISAVDKLVGEIESGRKYFEDTIEYEHKLVEWQEAIAEKEKELEKGFKKAKKDRDKKKKDAEEKGKEFKEKKYKEDKKPSPPKFDEDKVVMARVANGELPLVVEVHRAAEMRNLLESTEKFDRLRLVLAGGTEAESVAEELVERRIPVIISPSPIGTSRPDELAGHDLALAGRLADAGVSVLIGSGRTGAATRDLPLLAALAVGHGLDRGDAFEALTTGAARTLDVADRVGSLEPGKQADILILDGEPLASTTRVRYVIAGGQVVITPED